MGHRKDMERDFNSSPLSKHQIKLPKAGTQKGTCLEYLWLNKGKIVTKSDAEEYVFDTMGRNSKDLQSLRHLGKQDGFNILQGGEVFEGQKLKRGQYVFLGFDRPNGFYFSKRRKENFTGDWSDMKKEYDNCCATCGAPEGERHKHTNKIVVLEKGHMDPRKAMVDGNIIPQCSWCNQTSKDRWVYDRLGRVKAITERGLVSSHSVKYKKDRELRFD